MRVEPEAMQVLERSTIEGMKLFLPPGQLSRPLYVAVDKALKAMGGKWNTREKAHIFTEDPSELLDQVLMSGEIVSEKVQYQFFATPKALAEELVRMADVRAAHKILEPSAGAGAIVDALCQQYRFEDESLALDVCELNPKMVVQLKDKGFNVVAEDFLAYNPGPVYDRIIANPPFTKQQDALHIRHMIKMLKPGGRLVSVMSNSLTFRTTKLAQEVRALFDMYEAEVTALPEGSFKESGTGVNASVVVLDMPE